LRSARRRRRLGSAREPAREVLSWKGARQRAASPRACLHRRAQRSATAQGPAQRSASEQRTISGGRACRRRRGGARQRRSTQRRRPRRRGRGGGGGGGARARAAGPAGRAPGAAGVQGGRRAARRLRARHARLPPARAPPRPTQGCWVSGAQVLLCCWRKALGFVNSRYRRLVQLACSAMARNACASLGPSFAAYLLRGVGAGLHVSKWRVHTLLAGTAWCTSACSGWRTGRDKVCCP